MLSIGEARTKPPSASYVIIEFVFPTNVTAWLQSGSSDYALRKSCKSGMSVSFSLT